MKYSFFYLLLAAFIFFAVSSPAQTQPSPGAIQIGEKVTYNITFANFTDAGYAEIHAVGYEKMGDRDVIRLSSKLRTTGTVNVTLLALENEYNSLVAPDSLLPLRIERTLRESFAPTEIRRDFPENQTVNVNNQSDLLSAIYRLRAQPLSVGATFPLKVTENNQVYDAHLTVSGRKTVSTPIGAFNAFVVHVKLANNDEFNRYKMQILISDDDRRLPVSIQLKHPKGEIRAEIASVQIDLPLVVAVQPETTPTPLPTPIPTITPRPTPTPRPYVENQPLDVDLPFALGERLQYDLTQQNRKIASVLLEIRERKMFFNRDAVMLSATVTGSTSPLLPNGSSMISYIDPNFLVPFRSEVRAAGSLVKFNQVLSFDQERGFAGNDKGVQAEIPVGTYDFLSLAFALRAFRYEEGAKAKDTKAAIFYGKNARIISFKFTARERLQFGGKPTPTIVVNLTTGDPQTDSYQLKLWLTDDQRRLPLRFSFNSPSGTIQADLVQGTR